ncbi:MAG TPA: thiamine pyrophosphate-binding protein [Solirubrobacteraceae bacterium]|nr:thiamine pyrophosphate-binding protein [Solirubrobacteraceae bacterium]
MSRTGAELLVAGLEAAGVEVVFGLPGVHNLAAWEALRESPIRLVGVRHEQAAVYAADGYARATGRLGVALVTTGPGAANTLGACGEAWASRSPVLVVATDIPTSLRMRGVHRGVLHECVDQPGMFAPVTKHSFTPQTFAELALAAFLAPEAALRVPTRPVYLEIPTDLLAGRGEEPSMAGSAATPAAPDVEPALDLLAEAERPLVWAGGGAVAAGAGPSLTELADRLGAPIVTTYSGAGVAGDHALGVGLPPHVEEVGALWDEADLVLAIGSDLDGMMTQNWRMPAPPRLIAVNVDEVDAAKNYPPDVIVAGDASAACRALALDLSGDRRPWTDVAAVRERALARLRAEFAEELRFVDAFAAAVPDDAVVLCDMCIPGYWLGGFRRVTAPRRLIYPLGWGTLGCAFPQSLGAALAGAGPVVSVSGDGGFLLACGELATAAQERLPLTAVIVDDGGYGMLRYDQRRAGAASYGVDLHTPDFVALAASFGVRAEAVDGLDDAFASALARHVTDPAPSVLVARAALEPPPTTSPRWYRPAP